MMTRLSLSLLCGLSLVCACTADNSSFVGDDAGTGDGGGGKDAPIVVGDGGGNRDLTGVVTNFDLTGGGNTGDMTGGCGTGQALCGSACITIVNNPQHCGSCGNVCGGQTPLCMGTTCVAQCTGNLIECRGACVDTSTDSANCGGCGNACRGGATCVGGQCSGCGTGLTSCGGNCVDTTTDPFNCGGCGKVVCHLEVCTNSMPACDPGFTACGGVTGCLGCRNLLEDPENCGMCGTRCDSTQLCNNGQCTAITSGCSGGATQCLRACVTDPQTDPQHCGCNAGSAGQVCGAGELCINGNCETYSSTYGCNTCPCNACRDPNQNCCTITGYGTVCTSADQCP